MTDYEKEIEYRNSLYRSGRKLTSEERIWIGTHQLYNCRFGFPFLNIAVEKLEPQKWYLITVKAESVAHEEKIWPFIEVSGLKGKIIADFELVDYRGNISLGKPVKMLSCDLYEGEGFTVKYFSELGFISVGYGCDYFDTVINLNMSENSSTMNTDFAMKREEISSNKVRYYCKEPMSDSFDAIIFTVEWNEIKDA